MVIPPPVKPQDPVYEDAEAQPDQAHVWRTESDGEIDEWMLDAGYHNGPGCVNCNYSYCQHCGHDTPDDEVNCLRQQAEERNNRAKWAYQAAVKKYEAQMEYYRTLLANNPTIVNDQVDSEPAPGEKEGQQT